MSESTAPWQTYVTIAAFGLMIAAVLDGASALWFGSRGRSYLVPLIRSRSTIAAARLVLCGSVLGLAVFGVAVVRDSVLLTQYPEWHAAARVAKDYLAAIRPCVEAAPNGEQVVLADWPLNVDDTSDEYRLTMAGVFAPYSIAPAVYLTMDRPGLSVQAQKSEISVPPTNRGITATCSDAGGVWLVDTVYDPPLQQPHH